MRHSLYIYASIVLLLAASADLSAQVDKKDVRRGNRDFRKENYKEAEIDYLKALVKDSTSVAANYNLASSLFRLGDMEQARKTLDRIKDSAPMTPQAADYFYNLGDVALAQQDYQTAVEAFAQSLIRRPDDLNAKENFIYAREMLKNQQQNQQNQGNDQDQQDQNQDQNENQNDQDQNENQNQNDDQNNQDNQDQNRNQDQQGQNQQPKITPQAAQQMLQAIQAKEKETQDKVNREKAAALKSRQKDKNW
ncbi:MAG: tetratricopeptide repeat protein [Bacteroidales bacterium]|nr:tetratricopeptide repeat protein [Bacteroidales bacterium]